MMTTVRILILVLLVGGFCPWPAVLLDDASAMDSSDCLDCHGETDFVTEREGHEIPLFVDEEVYAASIHGNNEVACDECHADVTDDHPDEQQILAPVECGNCHYETATALSESSHAGHGPSDARKPGCRDCHGSHDILPADNPASRVYPLNVPGTCGGCHFDSSIVDPESAEFSALYMKGRHGISTEKGLLGAAICTDCHDSHAVTSSEAPDSPTNPAGISGTCGNCHKGTLDTYRQSVHGRAWKNGKQAPTCVSCHNPHDTKRVDKAEFQLGMVDSCGGCHPHSLKTYRASYHGQITDLGFTRMAKCVDCHGSHGIEPSNKPESLMSEENRLETCRQCHPSARQNFIGFSPHLDHHDEEKFPLESIIFGLMSALLLNTFLFFSIHTLLWFIRGIFEKVRKEGHPHLGNPTGRYFLRFNYYHRITHFLIFTSFVTLSVTGLPLKFHDYAWAKMLAQMLGGFEVAGVLHRMMGAVTFGYFAMHLGFLAYLALSGKMRIRDILWGPRSIVPQPNDAVELTQNFKWFLGLGPRPKFGRFTYWEKFDYFAVFWGVALIGLSGLILWLPELFTWFLPGKVINIAWIIHADEALLATGFIFLIHFFNTHLRVEKFPLDPVILTGRIDEEEMRHERPKEFALRRQDGSLREIQTTKPEGWLMVFSRVVGWTFVFIGFALLIAMLASFFV